MSKFDTYLHGTPGYGQKGIPGTTGRDGGSVHYSSIVDVDSTAAVLKINEGKALSNNDNYDVDETFTTGDIIINPNADIYLVCDSDSSLDASLVGTLVLRSDTESDTSLGYIDGSVSIVDSSIANPCYKAKYLDTSVYKHQEHYLDQYIPSYSITFTVKFNSRSSVKSMKAFVECGNALRMGETMLSLSGSSDTFTFNMDKKWVLISKNVEYAPLDYLKENGTLIVEVSTYNGNIYRFNKSLA